MRLLSTRIPIALPDAPSARQASGNTLYRRSTWTDRQKTLTVGRVADLHLRVAVLHALLRVTVGAKARYDALSLSFSRRPQHAMERGKGHLCHMTTCATASSKAAPAQVQERTAYARKCGITASAKRCMERITLSCARPPKAKLHPK